MSATDHRRRLRQLERAGWTVTQTGSGHMRLTHPAATGPIFTASTPSDWRTGRNLDALIRRALRVGADGRQE